MHPFGPPALLEAGTVEVVLPGDKVVVVGEVADVVVVDATTAVVAVSVELEAVGVPLEQAARLTAMPRTVAPVTSCRFVNRINLAF
ncbi:MAG: hypothetical protein ACRDZP_00580 [Acidimicrobiales bacterium]